MRLSLLLLLAFAQPKAFFHHATSDYGYLVIEGHGIYISPEAQASPELMRRAVARLRRDLRNIHEALPPAAMAQLAKVHFWIEGNDPEVPGMVYHPTRERLRQEHKNPDKGGGVEIGNIRTFVAMTNVQPWAVLHELAHAYHFQVLDYKNGKVKWAYQAALASHAYEKVARANAGKQRAYAMTNEIEYFAESSESYFGRNDYYPFVRSQLQTFDPLAVQMIEEMWFR